VIVETLSRYSPKMGGQTETTGLWSFVLEGFLTDVDHKSTFQVDDEAD